MPTLYNKTLYPIRTSNRKSSIGKASYFNQTITDKADESPAKNTSKNSYYKDRHPRRNIINST